MPKYPAPRGKLRTEVCIVGAGIAGLTTAYLLAKEGKRVIVLDEGPIGSGQTGRTSAHLASAIDDRFMEIERLHGREASRLAYQSHASAIDEIERIARLEGIECEFKRLNGYLSATPADAPELLKQEFDAAKRAKADVQFLRRGGLDGGACLRFGRQARFGPMKYLVGLARAIERMGGQIRTGRRVTDVQGVDTKRKTPGVAQLEGGPDQVEADHIVVATNTPAPINDWMGIYTKQASYRTYVIGAAIESGAAKDALYWDTGDPYHYVRLENVDRADEMILIGGEDHKTGQMPTGESPFEKLEKWARERFATMGRVRFRWSGQVQEPADGLAFIGRAPTSKGEVFVATGDSGMGLTHGTIAGMLITDLICGRKNPWEKLYDPSRKVLNRDFVRENANALKQYGDLFTGSDVNSIREIAPGQGALMRKGLKKLAVYRDEGGRLHRHSALCTHLQCVVQWNREEKTWDCPCHGSRFDPEGRVLMGPAVDDLAKEDR